MKLTNEQAEQLVVAYQKLTIDYKVSCDRFQSIVDNTTESYWRILFKKGDQTLNLEDAIKELDLPGPENLF